MLIRLENGSPVEHPVEDFNFRALFPGVSFPRYLTPSDVESFGFGLYEYSSQPQAGKYQKVIEDTPVKGDDGVWYQQWKIVDMNAAEKSQADEEQAERVRAQRSFFLSTSDWTQLPDSPVDGNAWLAYRQALRDVPAQTGFPWDVTWPEQPA